MSKINHYLIFFSTLLLFGYSACKNEAGGDDHVKEVNDAPGRLILTFSEDSAYHYVQQQVAFGPRIPGSSAHKSCAVWLEGKMRLYADTVIVQKTRVKAFDGTDLPINNIIASFLPAKKRRVLLCAHWDTRPYADEDTLDPGQTFDGANDGGSGVGVLLEIARQLNMLEAGIGVDIILFDTEDYGNSDAQDSYCLGSQYWAKNPHKQKYKADYGILLDMVGGKDATFSKEGISMYFAPHIVKKVWDNAAALGFRDIFLFNDPPYPSLTDDHLYINQLIGIPTIDIIEYNKDTPGGFGDFWHTQQDNMDIIDRTKLKAVGLTVLSVILEDTKSPS